MDKKEYYKSNKAYILDYVKDYYNEHKQQKSKYSRDYYNKNKNDINYKNKRKMKEVNITIIHKPITLYF